jgi:hypothetical protein
MLDDATPTLGLVRITDTEDFHLTGREQHLIENFRAMKSTAQDMLFDLSWQYRRTLPAVPVQLRLLARE